MKPALLLLLTTAIGLTACGGDGSTTPGTHAVVQTTYMNSSTTGDIDALTDPTEQASHAKAFTTAEDVYIELRAGLVNLKAVELIPCPTVASRLLDFVFPVALAHSDIPTGPAGVIDVLKPDLLVWDLGELSARPGSYCGIRLNISPLEADSHGDGHHAHSTIVRAETEGHEEDAFTMTGKGVFATPCIYENGPGSNHNCPEFIYTGDGVNRNLMFVAPIELNSNNRSVHLMLATEYSSWFNGLDIAYRNMNVENGPVETYPLEDNAAEQRQLARNVLNSFYVYSAE